MSLPDQINRDALLERIKKLFIEAKQADAHVPERIAGELEEMIRCLERLEPDLRQLSSYTGTIMYWYLDRGVKEIPAHYDISRLAIDIDKLYNIRKALDSVQSLVLETDAPQDLRELTRLLKSMLTIFTPDGRMDSKGYSELASQLRKITGANRAYLEKNMGSYIFHI
ncbi:MAG: hypothetical protein M1269_13020 [Chloroflexi bacterium]|nr:hypothetical protein [Chloroflexota bacterium]